MQLKYKQNEAVKEFVSGRDVFVSLPTGSSKSLCYAVQPAAVSVKSPLRTTLRQIFEADSAVLVLAHSHGCLYVCTSHTQGHTQKLPITLLPPSPFTPPTNCRSKGLGHAGLGLHKIGVDFGVVTLDTLQCHLILTLSV